MINIIISDSEAVSASLYFRLIACPKSVSLNEQEKALKNPWCAYEFARNIIGTDIEKCQEAVIKSPKCAYYFACNIPGADIAKCQAACLKDSHFAFLFALNVPGADIEKCRDAMKKPNVI